MIESTVRPATSADLEQVYDIWYEAEVADLPDPPPRTDMPAIFSHELNTGEMYVVEGGGQILAYAALITRSTISYLAEFYVRPAHQSSGVGKLLLRHILPSDGRMCCTLSSDDPRALALYCRAGMRPRWPHFLLRARTARLSDLPRSYVQAVKGRGGRPELVRWDAEIGGRLRPADHAYWRDATGATPLWFQRDGQVIGYGYVQGRSHEALQHPEALVLGPLGATQANDALACVCAAARWAAHRAPILLIGVPAAHPSLAPLLDAGFRITYVETFVSTTHEPFANPRCYIPSSSTLY
jgi:GNAT superfamily N-acetyltransferase